MDALEQNVAEIMSSFAPVEVAEVVSQNDLENLLNDVDSQLEN